MRSPSNCERSGLPLGLPGTLTHLEGCGKDVVDHHVGDAELADYLATEAGRLLLSVRESHATTSDLGTLGQAGDRAAQEYLARELAAARPGDAVLSEEAADDPRRLDAGRVWIIDPLDGTREFSEGRHDWAVHVALWERNDQGGGLVAGAVALPVLGITLATHPVPEYPAAHDGPPRIAVSRSRAPAAASIAAAALGAELVPMGSAGYKVAAVVRGEADAYVHAGGQFEWDSAAPVAVAVAAGMHASRLDGTALAYNRRDPSLPDLIVCRPELVAVLLPVLGNSAEVSPT